MENGRVCSDVPVLMGENPWKSIHALLDEKQGNGRDYENEAMRRGKMLESEARKRYCDKTGFEVNPACLQHKKYSWARASLDGISNDRKRIVEIKCGQKAYEMALFDEIPNYYYGQLQHIMFVTGLDIIDYWCYSPGEDGILLAMERNDSYINEAICIAEAYKGCLE